MTLYLIIFCVFVTICLICVIAFRMKQITAESNEIHSRLKFWLSEKSFIGTFTGDTQEGREDKEETFIKRVLVPLGEQMGHWMADKIPYTKQSAARKSLIKAGYRDKKALPYFYAIKICLGAGLGFISVCLLDIFTRDIQNGFILGIVVGIVGFILPNMILDKKGTERQLAVDKILPDALDLLVICTEAGMGIDQALLRVAANLGSKGKALTEEIVLTNREMNLGQDRAQCWNNMGLRANSEELKNLSRIIVQSEKVGSSIGSVLRSQAEFLRVRRRQKAEETAAKMTIKMMIPMALFIFPCIMAVTMGPPMVKLITTFGAMGN